VLRDLSSNAVLASGAVLGALALVFQGLLRDFVAGLVLLLDDRYAIGDVVEIGGRCGEVVDVGVLSTELRCADQRVVVVPNSHCEQVVNHTKLRSGAELTLLLPRSLTDLAGAMALIAAELAAFGSDPRWAPKLLEPPRLLGIEAMTEHDLQVKALLITEAGQQGPAQAEAAAGTQAVERWAQAAQGPFRIAEFGQPLGQLGPLAGLQHRGVVLADLPQAGLGAGPAGAPAGQVQRAASSFGRLRAGGQGGGQGGGVGREALQQLPALAGIVGAEGVEGIGAGRIAGEAMLQLAPQGLGCFGASEGRGGQGVLLEHQGGQGIGAPALPPQPLALLLGLLAASRQQQAGLPAPPGIGIPALQPLQPVGGGGRGERRLACQQRPTPQQGQAGAQARKGQQQGESGQWPEDGVRGILGIRLRRTRCDCPPFPPCHPCSTACPGRPSAAAPLW
jgi:hypothetical protein